MSWFPLGPDFVFAPRNPSFKRLSRRNALGRQSDVSQIVIDPADPGTIYVIAVRDNGNALFRKQTDEDDSWVSILDALCLEQDDPRIQPMQMALNPAHSDYLYVIVHDRAGTGLYVSNARGDPGSWGSRQGINNASSPDYGLRLLVDPNTADAPGTTVLYVAGSDGLHRSGDGGASWALVSPTTSSSRTISSLAASIPPAPGTPNFYLGVSGSGLWHTTDPTAAASWTNLNTLGIGLPAHTASSDAEPDGNFTEVHVDYCAGNPARVYAYFLKTVQDGSTVTAGLYVSSSVLASWEDVTVDSPPAPGSLFAVSPASAGDDADVLFLASVGGQDLYRSTDAGRNWTTAPDDVRFHADLRDYTLGPETPIPAVYIGCDGGIARSGRYADPAYDVTAAPADYNELEAYDPDSGVWENLNHGINSVALHAYASHPAVGALGYVGSTDTGIAGGSGALGWRSLGDWDVQDVAIAPGSDGVKVWAQYGHFSDWTGYARIALWTDTGDHSTPHVDVQLDGNGSLLAGTSNAGIDAAGNCVAGAIVRDSDRTLGERITLRTLVDPIVSTGSQTATLSSTSGFVVGTELTIDSGSGRETVAVTAVTAQTFTATFTKTHAAGVTIVGPLEARPSSMSEIDVGTVLIVDSDPNQEVVTATATTPTTFTASFTMSHEAGVPIQLERGFVARIDEAAAAAQISQDFHQNGRAVYLLAVDPTDPDVIYCATDDQRLWKTDSGSTATGDTAWTELTSGKPSGSAMTSIVIDAGGSVYVLLGSSVTTTTGGVGEQPLRQITSPLFAITADGIWVHQSCNPVPATRTSFGTVIADATSAATLYEAHEARVYKVSGAGGQWAWEDVSDGLPGQEIQRLWCGNIAPPGAAAKKLLRAAVAARGAWERDVTDGATDAPVSLYLRDHVLDQGRLSPSPEGMPNPYEPDSNVWHYQCEDIKIDSQQQGDADVAPFFQSDPEGSQPITHVLFDQLRDNSQNLAADTLALVHVQVHNRSFTPARNVRVWAIYCNAAAGMPALPDTFWHQFSRDGQITPNLPAHSRWKSIGQPTSVNEVSVTSPRVASWTWNVPALRRHDTGHYCTVVFVHGAAAPLDETSLDVDDLAYRNNQIGQKNLHLVSPPLPADSPSTGTAGGGAESGTAAESRQEYVEFHNPTASPRQATLIIDLTSLPPEIEVAFRLTKLTTAQPLPQSLSGVASTRRPGGSARAGPRLGSCLVQLGRLIRRLGCWIENLGRRCLRIHPRPCPGDSDTDDPGFEPAVYTAASSARVEVQQVELAPFGFCAALISIRNAGRLPAGNRYRFEVQQEVSGRVVGGSTFVIPVAGEKDKPPELAPDDW